MTGKSKPPFQERKTFWRGPLDLALGAYPRFLFGSNIGSCLPVFHFHEVDVKHLEPYFAYLAENQYRTVSSDEVAAWVTSGRHPGQKTVAITFDDAWSSFWFTAFPLLKKYQLQTILFVSPGRIQSQTPPRADPGGVPDSAIDRKPPMFCSWPELEVMQASGWVDIQAHGYQHAKIACFQQPAEFIRPRMTMHPHEIPILDSGDGPRFACAEDLGTPLFPVRSRLSDAHRWVCPEATRACTDLVTSEGGPLFFEQTDWEIRLMRTYDEARSGHYESEKERDLEIRKDLIMAREHLETHLNKNIQHLCFPWAIAGSAARRMAAEEGYRTAFSDRLGGYRAVRAGDPPHQLMRLKHEYIFCLPGKMRTWFFGKKPAPAHRGLNLDHPPIPEKASP